LKLNDKLRYKSSFQWKYILFTNILYIKVIKKGYKGKKYTQSDNKSIVIKSLWFIPSINY